MPSDQYFTVEILVGDCSIPEYTKNGCVYVESNLFTPVSYSQRVSEVVNGETETQNIPVTPYKIRLMANGPDLPDGFSHYYRVTVDGAKVKGLSLPSGQLKLIKGFRDGLSVRELLFSMPKNSKNQDEQLALEKVTRVGRIEVECWKAKLLERSWELRQTGLNFQQASKQDSLLVTKGSYTMATSKAGKELYQRRVFRTVDQWKRVQLLSRQSIQYHMGHTLQNMGIILKPYPIMASSSVITCSSLDWKDDKKDVKDEDPDVPSTSADANSPPPPSSRKRRHTLQQAESLLMKTCGNGASKKSRHSSTDNSHANPDSESFLSSQTRDIDSVHDRDKATSDLPTDQIEGDVMTRKEAVVTVAEKERVSRVGKGDIMTEPQPSTSKQNEDFVENDEVEVLLVTSREQQSKAQIIDLT